MGTRSRETPREGWLEREDLRLHFVDWPGDGERPVFALHGLSSNARFWSRVAARLDGRRVVALDQRSHGGSGASRENDTAETFVGDAAFAIGALGLRRPVVAGHSWGATIALELAARHPDLLSALAFIDGPAWPLAEVMGWDAFASRAQPPLPRYADLDAAIAAMRGAHAQAWDDDLVEFVRAGHVRDGDAVVLPLTHDARARILRDLFSLRQDLAWPQVTVPALAAFASRKSEVMLAASRRAADRLGRVAPKVLIKWYDSPHDIPLYAPDEIARDIAGL
ncbi:MAG TPA: alpha/beta hydrolase [Candidatus Limnocylindria bacterium]|nr:alpha/beta hydrolase [Candidatus Limnocylindria bacterium]